MSWLYSLALVEEYSGESCSDGEQSVLSSLMNTPAMFLWQGKTTEALKLSRYGMMCELLTENRGEDILKGIKENECKRIFRIKRGFWIRY